MSIMLKMTTLEKNRKGIVLFLCYAFIPLVVGFYIYVFYGASNTYLFGFVSEHLGPVELEDFRVDLPYLEFVRNHLADGLWSFSLTSTLCLLLYREFALHKLLCVALLVSTLYELSQYFDFIGGTGDVVDVVVMFAFSLFSYFQIKNKLSL